MPNKNPWKFFLSLFAFAVFAAVSCYFTSESLILSGALGDGIWSAVGTVALVVGFFVLTSLGSKWVVDSLTNGKMEHRRAWMIGGTLIVLVFWLMVSFPTNIHALLFNRSSKSVAVREMGWLEKEMGIITDEKALVARIGADIIATSNRVDELQKKLIQEIEHPNRPGVRDSAWQIMRRIEGEMKLKPNTILEVRMAPGNAADHYNKVVDNLQDEWEARCKKDLLATIANHEQNVKDAQRLDKTLRAYEKALDDGNNGFKLMKSIITTEDECYKVIDLYHFFGNTTSREEYISTEKGMPLARLTNVGEVVYGDYLHRRLKNYDLPATKSLFYLVLIALLFDLAAFLFFNIAFQSTNTTVRLKPRRK